MNDVAIDRRLEFNDTVGFFSFVSKNEVGIATKEVQAMYFLAKYTLNLPYIYPIFPLKKNSIFLYNFDQKWLDALDNVNLIDIIHLLCSYADLVFTEK
jgi:hypothetical protein